MGRQHLTSCIAKELLEYAADGDVRCLLPVWHVEPHWPSVFFILLIWRAFGIHSIVLLSQVPVTSASLNPDGRMVAAGGQGGSLHLLPLSSYAGKSHVVDEAHG